MPESSDEQLSKLKIFFFLKHPTSSILYSLFSEWSSSRSGAPNSHQHDISVAGDREHQDKNRGAGNFGGRLPGARWSSQSFGSHAALSAVSLRAHEISKHRQRSGQKFRHLQGQFVPENCHNVVYKRGAELRAGSGDPGIQTASQI